MSKRVFSRREEPLAEALRREARGSRPEFSHALHAKICRALRNREFRAIHAPREFVHRRVRGNWLPVAVAGACLLALGTAFWLKGQLVRNSGTESAHSGAEVVADHQDQWTSDWLRPDARFSSVTALAKRMPGEFDYWLDSSATAYQWAGLDHDARLTIRMLASRLPFDVGASLAATGDSL